MMKNLITKLTFIAILGLTTFSACKKEDETPAHLGKWKLATLQELEFSNNVKTFDTTYTLGQETILFHFKDATNLDVSETDETGTINDTENYTYKIENGKLIITDVDLYTETLENFNINGSKLSFKVIDVPSGQTADKLRMESIYNFNKM